MALPRVGCRAVAPWITTALLWAATAHAVTSGGDAARADVQRALTLLNVVAEEYREGVVGCRGGRSVLRERARRVAGAGAARAGAQRPRADPRRHRADHRHRRGGLSGRSTVGGARTRTVRREL